MLEPGPMTASDDTSAVGWMRTLARSAMGSPWGAPILADRHARPRSGKGTQTPERPASREDRAGREGEADDDVHCTAGHRPRDRQGDQGAEDEHPGTAADRDNESREIQVERIHGTRVPDREERQRAVSGQGGPG